MKRIFYSLLVISLFSINLLSAQNPFKDFGYEVDVITLSKGKYIEFIPYDSLQHIGSVVINIKTGHIVEMINTDSVELGYNYRPDVASRWISPDPLAEEYWSWSPYNYTMNNPINLIDPNGMYVDWYQSEQGQLLWTSKDGDIGSTETFNGETYNWVADDGAKLGTGGRDLIISSGAFDPDENMDANNDAVEIANGTPNESVIALVGDESEMLSAMENTTTAFGSIDNVVYRGHGAESGLTLDGDNFNVSSLKEFNNLVNSEKIKFSAGAQFSFLSCNSFAYSWSFTDITGISSIGANSTVGFAHYLYGSGHFNTDLTGKGNLDANQGFYQQSKTNGSVSSLFMGKVLNVPSILNTGSQTLKVKKF